MFEKMRIKSKQIVKNDVDEHDASEEQIIESLLKITSRMGVDFEKEIFELLVKHNLLHVNMIKHEPRQNLGLWHSKALNQFEVRYDDNETDITLTIPEKKMLKILRKLHG